MDILHATQLDWPHPQEALACAQACQRLATRFAERFDWTGVYVRNPAGDLQLVAFMGAPTEHVVIPVAAGICGAAVRENAVQNIADVRADERFIACSLSTRAELVVPIRDAHGEAVAEIDIDSDRAGAFPPEVVTAVEAEATHLGRVLLLCA